MPYQTNENNISTKKLDRFVDFTFHGISASSLKLKRVSSGSRFSSPLLPPLEASVESRNGNGSYYFGQREKPRVFPINLAFDSVTNTELLQISNWLRQDVGPIVFDECPGITFYGKIDNSVNFQYIPFEEQKKIGEEIITTLIYKGEISFNFVCYDPYGYKIKTFPNTAIGGPVVSFELPAGYSNGVGRNNDYSLDLVLKPAETASKIEVQINNLKLVFPEEVFTIVNPANQKSVKNIDLKIDSSLLRVVYSTDNKASYQLGNHYITIDNWDFTKTFKVNATGADIDIAQGALKYKERVI